MATTTATEKLFASHNDLPAGTRSQMVTLLNQQLADMFDLHSQVKQAHWNVKGLHFYQLHLLFDTLAGELEGHIDVIAERATALGGKAKGTARMAVENSRLPEYPDVADGKAHVTALVERYAAVCKSTREAITIAGEAEDDDTVDLFTTMSRDLDKNLWFLEAHLQG
jgi:starvation-inducible DNA-binding protein